MKIRETSTTIKIHCECGMDFYVPRTSVPVSCPKCLQVYAIKIEKVFD